MSVGYQIMYRLGITPWVHGEPPEPLAALIEGPRSLPPGDMLDIGCGTGQDAIYAARHNWNVTGVDVVPRALEQARRNARGAGAAVEEQHADARLRGDLGDASSHHAGADHGEAQV